MKTAFPVPDRPIFAERLAPLGAAVGMLTCAVLLPTVHADSSHRSPRTAVQWTGLHTRVLDANHLAMWVSNVGSFALNPFTFDSGLEYPRGSGKPLVFAAGIWIAGRAMGSVRTAVTEFGWEFVPGPIVNGTYATDTLRYKVYKVSRSDTTGWGEWVARAAPMGAPLDASRTKPAFMGDQTLWTVFNDASPVPFGVRRGSRLTPPIGLEVQLTAYAFDRDGPLKNMAFLHYRVIHKGTNALDSAFVGLFMDPKTSSAPLLGACDTSLDVGYAYRSGDDPFYGAAGPSVGLDLLRGPRDPATHRRLRMTSFVVYANGIDPADAHQFYDVLRGLEPWGAAIVDSSTGEPSPFYSSGDPVSGAGWVATVPPHPHWALSSGPFRLAAGDTQEVDAALVVGQGQDRLSSITEMRNASREAQRLFDQGFVSVPAPEVLLLRVWPNPGGPGAHIAYSVGEPESRVEIEVYDIAGRRVRELVGAIELQGDRQAVWDGSDDDGRPAPPGLYLVRVAIAGRMSHARVALVR